MTDTQHSTLKTPCIRLGIPEHRMWILPHFKIPHSNTWSWCWSFKCRVLINRNKFRTWTQNLWSILRTLHSGFTLHTQDSPIQIHWVLSVECWVSVISLGPVLNIYTLRMKQDRWGFTTIRWELFPRNMQIIQNHYTYETDFFSTEKITNQSIFIANQHYSAFGNTNNKYKKQNIKYTKTLTINYKKNSS